MKKFVVLSVIFIFLVSVVSAGFALKNWMAGPNSNISEEVIYEVVPGNSFKKVSDDLFHAKVVKHSGLFYLWAKVYGQTGRLKAGEYLLNKNMTANEVLAVITSGKSMGRPLTIAEGLNIYDIADLYQEKGFGSAEEFLKLVKDPAIAQELTGKKVISLEGYLFPETYQVTKKTTAKELIQQMVRRHQSVFNELTKDRSIPPELKDENEFLTLASIIEKETGAPEERPMIASVFYNRIRKGMLLQTDPTILYGMWDQGEKREIQIRKSDILRPTRYNTYVIRGLPPGPIANPGREAMLAVLEPAKEKYLYFVSRNNGTHAFAETLEEHNRNVNTFQKKR